MKITRLEALREENNYKQKDIAKILNVKSNTYAKWERETNDMPLEKCNELVNFYNVSFDYLLGISNKRTINEKSTINWNIICNKLKELRKSYKYSQKQVGDKIGFVQTTYSNYENGIRKITTFKLYLIVMFYNVSFDYIIGTRNIK